MSSVHIVRAGMFSTIQDTGRHGLRRYGIVRGGAADLFALRCANLLVGNSADAAGLECTIAGPVVRFTDRRYVALGGFDPEATLDGSPVPPFATVIAHAGSELHVADTGSGSRAYAAVSGGFDVPVVLHSRATDVTAGIGGIGGRALRDGDTLPLGDTVLRSATAARAGRSMMPRYSKEPVLRVSAGPDAHTGSGAEAFEQLLRRGWTVAAQSNRMGCRLEGDPVATSGLSEMVSSPVMPGTVQLPPSGLPIVLLADAQTIGGYPRIAHVVSVDIPVVAQLRPGQTVRFAPVSFSDAVALVRQRERDLLMLADAVRLAAR